MDIIIVNEMGYPVHVTIVEHSALSIEFVLSHGQVPIPMGTPIRREMLEDGQILVMQNLHASVRPTLTKRRMPDILIVRTRGTAKKDTPFVMVTLRPADGDPEKEEP